MRPIFIAVSLAMLSACSTTDQTNHLFTSSADDNGITHFQLNYLGEADANKRQSGGNKQTQSKPEQRPSGGAQRGKGGGKPPRQGGQEQQPQQADSAVPQYNNLTDPHFLIELLETELDNRQLCPLGYHIEERRPTTNGMVMIGHCDSMAKASFGL